METPKYIVDIRWSSEDDAYIARVPELDGVVTHGSTYTEAAKMAEEAIALHLESLRAHNERMPDPVALEKVSGKYPLRMSKETHQDLLIEAHKENVSLNEYVNNVLEKEIRIRRMATGKDFRVRRTPASVRGKRQSPKSNKKNELYLNKKKSVTRGIARKSS